MTIEQTTKTADGARVKLAVVMPCFNERRDIGRQLRALAAQKVDMPWQVVVADNGSTDGTQQEVEAMRHALPGLLALDAAARRGAAYARNVGVRATTAELLVFVDADDEVAPDFLPIMAAAIERHGFVASRLDDTKLNKTWATRHRRCVQRDKLQSGHVHPSLSYAGGGTLGIKRSLHDAVGGFDETLVSHEDTDYCLRVQGATGVELQFVPDAFINISWPESFVRGFQQLRGWAANQVEVQRRHHPEAFEKLRARRQAWNLAKQCLGVRRVRDGATLNHWAMSLGNELGAFEGVMRERLKLR